MYCKLDKLLCRAPVTFSFALWSGRICRLRKLLRQTHQHLYHLARLLTRCTASCAIPDTRGRISLRCSNFSSRSIKNRRNRKPVLSWTRLFIEVYNCGLGWNHCRCKLCGSSHWGTSFLNVCPLLQMGMNHPAWNYSIVIWKVKWIPSWKNQHWMMTMILCGDVVYLVTSKAMMLWCAFLWKLIDKRVPKAFTIAVCVNLM